MKGPIYFEQNHAKDNRCRRIRSENCPSARESSQLLSGLRSCSSPTTWTSRGLSAWSFGGAHSTFLLLFPADLVSVSKVSSRTFARTSSTKMFCFVCRRCFLTEKPELAQGGGVPPEEAQRGDVRLAVRAATAALKGERIVFYTLSLGFLFIFGKNLEKVVHVLIFTF